MQGLQPRVVPSDFAEDLDKSKFTPAGYVEENSYIKASRVLQQLKAAGTVSAPARAVQLCAHVRCARHRGLSSVLTRW